jgi:RNA polymerase sigma factor (sigma-70 family)
MTSSYASVLLTSYRHDLAQVQPLSEQEVHHLTEAASAHQDTQAWYRLIEHYLPLTMALIMRYCPRAYAFLLPDMIGEVNLRLLQALKGFAGKKEIKPYLLFQVKVAVVKTLYEHRLVRIPPATIRRAIQQDTIDRLTRAEPISLEAALARHERELDEIQTQPLLPTEATPSHRAALRDQIDAWLTHLSARDEQIVRLHYGLMEEDERCYTTREIARLTGCTLSTVERAHRSALQRFRMLADGTATFTEQDGRQVAMGMFEGTFRPPTLTPEQEAHLKQVALELAAQGRTITVLALSQASGFSHTHTMIFLRQHQQELPQAYLSHTPEARQRFEQARRERIRQVYEQQRAQGRPVAVASIAKEAHVSHEAVTAFLRERGESYLQERDQERQKRVREVYDRWRAQGKRLSASKIAAEAHADYRVVQTYIRQWAKQASP